MSSVGHTFVEATGPAPDLVALLAHVQRTARDGAAFTLSGLMGVDRAPDPLVDWADLKATAERVSLSVGTKYNMDCLGVAERLAQRFPALRVTGYFTGRRATYPPTGPPASRVARWPTRCGSTRISAVRCRAGRGAIAIGCSTSSRAPQSAAPQPSTSSIPSTSPRSRSSPQSRADGVASPATPWPSTFTGNPARQAVPVRSRPGHGHARRRVHRAARGRRAGLAWIAWAAAITGNVVQAHQTERPAVQDATLPDQHRVPRRPRATREDSHTMGRTPERSKNIRRRR